MGGVNGQCSVIAHIVFGIIFFERLPFGKIPGEGSHAKWNQKL
jgi:hypothetical protein